MTQMGARTAVPATQAKRPLSVVLFVSGEELDRRHHERGSGVIDGERQMGSPHRSRPATTMQLTLARSGQRQGTSPFMVDSGHMMRRAVDRRGPKPIHRSGHPEFVELVAEDPLLSLERGQRLFAEGDVPTCMYIVRTGQLQIRSGGIIYEDFGPGGIIGEKGVIEAQGLRSAAGYAPTHSELVEINGPRCSPRR